MNDGRTRSGQHSCCLIPDEAATETTFGKNAFPNVKTTETKIDLYDAGGVISWKDQIKGKV